ncbi:tetratricopeptide repeat protein [Haliangium sp.]|uniref:tetratricopeptide repeat protein n=1 Tax=Haliangium sp. TaxID=2663208 RepID=UPI003D115DCE
MSTPVLIRLSRPASGRPRAGAVLAILCVLAPLASGCFWVTTKREGEQLAARVDSLDTRLGKREEDLASKIQRLEEVLAQATTVLQRNSADLGADVQVLDQRMRELQGAVAEATQLTATLRAELTALSESVAKDKAAHEDRLATLESLETRVAAIEKQATTPASADDLYTQGRAAFEGSDYAKARALFQQLVVRYPGHERADDSQYYRGEAYFREKDYDGAIREFQKVFDKFPTSSLADDALYRAGEAAERLRRCSEARAYFGLLRQKYPQSALVEKSKAKDQDLKKKLKDKKKCLS